MSQSEVWFHRNLFGYWPVHWKGWAVTLLAVLAVFGMSYGAIWMSRELGRPGWAAWMIPLFVLPAFAAWFMLAVRHAANRIRT